MNASELERVRSDLATIREAAGLGLPFNRRDIIDNFTLAILGIVSAAWVWLCPQEPTWLAKLPLAVIVPSVAWAAVRSYRQRGPQPRSWREYRDSLLVTGVFLSALFIYGAWEAWRTDASFKLPGASAVVFFLGAGLLAMALLLPARRYCLGIAVPAMIVGLILPFCSIRQELLAIFLMFGIGGSITAAIQLWQLREVPDGRRAD